MTIDRSRRITFEEQAVLYDEIAHCYPEKLIEDIRVLSGIPADGRILEIGCGPGNATVSFAKLGYAILAIELGTHLAALAAKNCRPYPRVEIRKMPFEDWEPEEGAFDLAIAADAFHWIQPELGYPRVARALKKTGSIAFFWRLPFDPQTDWSEAIGAVYREQVSQADNPDKLFTKEWLAKTVTETINTSQCFGGITVRQYSWSETLTGEQYIKSLWTYSGHREMDGVTRKQLYAGIQEVIERFGGKVDRPCSVVLFHSFPKK